MAARVRPTTEPHEEASLSEALAAIGTNLHGVACALIKYQSGEHPANPELEPSMLYMLSDLLAAEGDRLHELSDTVVQRRKIA